MSAVTELVRNLKTETVHRASCSSKGADFGTWNWAVGKSLSAIRDATITYPWLHLCQTCMPGCCRCEKCGAS